MSKTENETKCKLSCATGNIFLAVNDTATHNRLTNVFGKRERDAGMMTPASTYNYEEANKQ